MVGAYDSDKLVSGTAFFVFVLVEAKCSGVSPVPLSRLGTGVLLIGSAHETDVRGRILEYLSECNERD